MESVASPLLHPASSPPLRASTPPPVLADRIIRTRKGNPPQIQLSEMSEDQIEQTIDCLVETNALTDAFLLNAIGPRTKRLNLASCYYIRKYSLGMIPQQCANLQSIDLTNCRQVDNKLVSNLLRKCPNLKQLVLDGCVRVTDAAFFPADGEVPLKNLTKLFLAGCRQITEEALMKIANKCEDLVELSLSGGRNSVTKQVLTSIFDLAIHTGKLRSLDVSDCAVLASDDAFVQYQLKLEFSAQLLPITSLKLGGLSGLPPKYTWKTIQAIANMCGPNLVELDTTWSSSVTDQACYALATNCPNIKVLKICNSQITASGLEMIATSHPQLQVIDLSWCLKIDSKAVGVISRAQLSALTELKLSHCVDFLSSKTSPIAPIHVIELIENCGERLKKLELTGLPKLVTPEVLNAISTHCHSLAHFTGSLGGDSWESIKEGFERFASTVDSITNLTIDVSRIQAEIDVLADGLKYPNLPNLARLSLSANPKAPFGDSLLESVLVNRIGLEHLELRNCRDVSADLFQTWIQGYTPDKEATLVVDAMLDAELQGYLSSTSSARQTVLGRYSDSEAPTVVFRGKLIKSHHRKKKKQNLGQPTLSSCSETDATFAVGFEMLRNTIKLSDAARAMDSLKSLTLVGASKLTDASLDRLSLMMAYMQSVEIIDAPLVTEEAVEPIRRRCRLLRALEITGPKLRVRIDSSRFINRRRRRKAQFPSKAFIATKRKLSDDDEDD